MGGHPLWQFRLDAPEGHVASQLQLFEFALVEIPDFDLQRRFSETEDSVALAFQMRAILVVRGTTRTDWRARVREQGV